MTERYQIISLIEEDQLGSVYLAKDTTLQRNVIFRSFHKMADGKRPEGFSSYTGKLCALQHPNLLTIYDISSNEKGYFMVTQFLEGESLEQRLSQGALNQVGVHNMACDVLDALHAAHSSGLFHGALRTDSIKRLPRVRGGHRYLIVDFGQDRLSSMLCGSPVMMADPVMRAPELSGRNKVADSSSDLFTLGQLCYIALVGGHPYAGKSPEECAQAYQDGGLPHLSAYVQGVQSDFADWVMWLVSGSPDKRPFSSQQAMDALHAITLKAPSPNVPGRTEAVNVPTAPLPQTPKISQAIQVVKDPPSKSAKRRKSAKVSKDKQVMYVALGIIFCLLAVVAYLLLSRNDSPDQGAVAPVVKKAMVVMREPQYISPLLTNKDPVNINLDGKNIIDWTVVKGVPASSRRVLMKGGTCIRNIIALGEFSEFTDPRKMLTYSAGGTLITPKWSVTSSKKGEAKEGEGWEIYVRVPEDHKGALLVTLYMIQNQCDFNVEVRSTFKANEGKVVKFVVPKKQADGVVKIPLKILEPAPGYYTIRVLATAGSVIGGFEMGLSAIVVESS